MKAIVSTAWEQGATALKDRLIKELSSNRRVLWLLSGGSNIAASVDIMDGLAPELSTGLTLSLVDERYGPPGHSDSNWAQLEQAGLAPKKAHLLPILKAGQTFEQALHYYQELFDKAFAAADSIIALLGIGQDGHIAGILPNSPAVHAQDELITGYQSPPYKRLTLTFPGLRRVTAAYAFAFGDQKRTAITNLCDKNLSLKDQPAQILKELPEAYLYSDQIGEKS